VALLVIATAQLMVVLDATIVNVALPNIQRDLGFSGTGLEWVVNAYALTFGGLMLLGGRAGDLLGRRRMFVAGLLLFSAASLLGGFATSDGWLLAARAVQGAGAAIIAPTALALIATTFAEGAPRNRAMAVYSAMSVAGGAVGLLAGGLLTTYASWRWVMFVNVPIGLAAVLAAPRVLRESATQRGRFDLPGALAGTGGLAALVYGLVNAATTADGVSHWGDAKVVVALAASVLLLAAFAVIEARSRHPLLPLRLLRDRDRTGANLIMLCVGAAIFGMFFFLTVFMQTVWGYSALKTGVAYLPLTSMIMVGVGRRRSARRAGRRPAAAAGRSPDRGRGSVLAVQDQRKRQLPRGCAGADARPRDRAWPAVRAAHPRRHGPGPRRGVRRRGQPAQHRPAGRRLDRAGRARHGRLDRRREQCPRPDRAGRGEPDRSIRPAQPLRAHRDLQPRAGHRVLARVRGRGRDHGARSSHRDRRDPGAACRPRRRFDLSTGATGVQRKMLAGGIPCLS
jgi:MFS family permease